MILTRRLAMAAVLFAGALFTTGASAEAPMGDGGTIRLMSNPVGTQSYPPYVIDKFKLDEKYGFKLEVIPFTNPQAAVAALQSASIEAVVQDWISVARLRNQNIPVIGVAPFLAYVNTVLLPPDSTVTTLADLKGKRLGTYTKTGFDWIILQAVAKQQYGFDLAKEVTIQEGAPSLLRGSMEQGQLDATLMYNSLTPDMILSGKAKLLMTIHDVVAELGLAEAPFLMYAMREDYAKANPANAKAFVAAYQEAIEHPAVRSRGLERAGAEHEARPRGDRDVPRERQQGIHQGLHARHGRRARPDLQGPSGNRRARDHGHDRNARRRLHPRLPALISGRARRWRARLFRLFALCAQRSQDRPPCSTSHALRHPPPSPSASSPRPPAPAQPSPSATAASFG